MAQTIKIKRSSTSGNKLTSSNSVAGELGLNTADKALYIQTGSTNGDVVTIAHESTLKIDEVNGRIGIGTTTPDEALVVSGDGARIYVNSADYHVAMIGRRGSSGTSLDQGYIRLKDQGTNKVVLDTAGSSYFTGGNVGIGTTSPTSISNYNSLSVDGTSGSLIDSYTNGTLKGRIQSTSSGYYLYAQGATTTIRLGTNNTERMRISSSGEVGIATTSPLSGHKLTVNGKIGGLTYIDSYVEFTGGNAILKANDDVILGYNSSLYVKQSGNVGIGTASPAKELDVLGTVRAIDGNSDQHQLRPTQLISYGTDAIINAQSAGDDVLLRTQGNTRLIATAEGNVGIGTTSPQTALHIYDTPAEILRMEGNDEFAYASFYGTVSSTAQRLGYMGFANDTGTAADFNFTNNQSGIFSFNAGINVTSGNLTFNSEGQKLIFKTSSTGAQAEIYTGDTFGTNRLIIEGENGIHNVIDGNSNSVGDWSVYNERLATHQIFLTGSNGYFGIGTANPAANLDIAGTLASPPTLRLSNTTTAFTQGDNVGQIEFYHADPTDFTPGAFGIIRGVAGASGGEGSIQVLTNMPSEGTDANDVAIEFTGAGAVKISNAFTLPTSDGSGNQVLQTDGSGNVGWATISGVGTATEIADADGDTRIQTEESADEDQIRFDAAGVERFRIGSDVQVIGTSDFNITGSSRRLSFTSGTGTVRTTGASSLHLGTNSTDRVTIDSSGNVGIGTSSPVRPLHIHQTSNSQMQFTDDTSGSTSADGLRVGWNGTEGQLYLFENAALRFATNNSERMRIDSSGNVGIGTTSPGKLLTLSRSAEAQNEQLEFRTEAGGISDGNYDGIVWTYGTNGGTTLAEQRVNYYTTGVVDMSFNLRNEDNVLYLKAGGNVGIGTASPTNKLHIVGNTFNTGQVRANTGTAATPNFTIDGGAGMFKPTSNVIGFSTNSTERLRIASGNPYMFLGNTGHSWGTFHAVAQIGRTGAVATYDSGANQQTIIANNTYYGGSGYTSIEGTTGASYMNVTQGQVRFYTAPSTTAGSAQTFTQRLKITNAGNVGIGEDTPAGPLHVTSAGNISYFEGTAGNVSIQLVRSDASGAVDFGDIQFANSTGIAAKINSRGEGGSASGNLTFQTRNTSGTLADRVRITSAGRVGINESSPDALLHITGQSTAGLIVENGAGNASTQPYVSIAANNYSSGYGTFRWEDQRASQASPSFIWEVHDGSGSVLAYDFRTGATGAAGSKLAITQDGRVGIGTTSPNYKFEISDGTRTGVFNPNSTLDGFFIGTYQAKPLILGTTDTERMRISSSGNIGINQTNPTHRLQVSVDANGAFIKRDVASNAANLSEFNSHRSLLLLNRNSGSYLAFGGNSSRTDIQATDLAGTPTAKIISLNPFGGSVGVGVTSPGGVFDVNGTYGDFTVGNPSVGSRLTYYGTTRILLNSNDIVFSTNSLTERMRVNSSGDWMVSNTVANVASAYSTQGGCGWVESDNHFEAATTSNRSAAEFGRNNANSGDVITIRQQGTSVGMIGTEGGDSLVIQSNGSTGSGLRFHPSGASIQPVRAGVTIDNTISLGADTRRFKDLHLSNAANIGHASIETSSTSTTATTQVAIATFAAATFRGAEFTIQVTNSTDSTYHLTKVLLIHDGTTPGITEYGTVFTGSAAEATFDADISSGNVRLLATPASTDSMTFKVVRHCITV